MIFPGDQISRYTKVDVILLSWADEDPKLPVSLEIDQLAETFISYYGYGVEIWLIPAEDSHNKVQAKILQFLDGSDTSHLKVVYYAGHGRLTNHVSQPLATNILVFPELCCIGVIQYIYFQRNNLERDTSTLNAYRF